MDCFTPFAMTQALFIHHCEGVTRSNPSRCLTCHAEERSISCLLAEILLCGKADSQRLQKR